MREEKPGVSEDSGVVKQSERADVNMENKFRIGIAGCGGMGSGHAIALKSGTGDTVYNGNVADAKMPDSAMTTRIGDMMELSGVTDIDKSRQAWAREQGIFVYEDYAAMLSDESVDAVLIATPNHLHKSMAMEALRAGKHILCEKPVMMCSADLAEVMKEAEMTGRVFYPRQNREWDEDYLIIRKIYQENLLGRTFEIRCRIMGARGIPGDWRSRRECGGGMMYDWGVHVIDRTVKMIPERLRRIYCDLKYITNQECDDNVFIHFTFESGLTVRLEVDTCHFIRLPLWNLYADQGTAEIDSWNCDGRMVRLSSWEDKDTVPVMAGSGLSKTMAPRGRETLEELPLPRFDFDRNALYRNFVETCLGTAQQTVTADHALRVLRIMEACFRSAREGRVIEFE